MATTLEKFKSFLSNYKDQVLIPLAKQGVLSAEIINQAKEMYLEEMENRKAIIETREISKKGDLADLHPFYMSTFVVDGIEYKSIEHFWRSKRYTDTADEFAEEIRATNNAAVAHRKSLNAGQSHEERPDWKDIRKSELKKALESLAKTDQKYRDALLSTDIAKLIFVPPPEDEVLGVNDKGEGMNLLGNLLVEVREELLLG